MNENQKNVISIVLGIFAILVGMPTYMKTNALEDLIVYTVPGLIMIGIGIYKMFRKNDNVRT